MCFDCLTFCNQTAISCVFEETQTLTRCQTGSTCIGLNNRFVWWGGNKKSYLDLGYVCFRESGFHETTFLCLFVIRKVGQRKTLYSQKNLAWFLGKCFPGNFGWKILSGSCEKFKNIILFPDYIKFSPQTFDCYIYFVLNIYFSISSLKI
jgi:hypothetical protein